MLWGIHSKGAWYAAICSWKRCFLWFTCDLSGALPFFKIITHSEGIHFNDLSRQMQRYVLVHHSVRMTFRDANWTRVCVLPAVGYAAAVASHSQTFLQVRCKAWGGDAPAAVGTYTLLVFPLVVHLAKDVQPRLVHNFWEHKTDNWLFGFLAAGWTRQNSKPDDSLRL